MDSTASDGPSLTLSDISDFKEFKDLGAISVAGMFTTFLVILSTRIGGFGGVPLNTFFDVFGIEGVVSMVTLSAILLQITRYAYTVFYERSGKGWSPFVFICILLGVELIHDLVFYYGVISQLPKGKNEMVDILRALVNTNKLYVSLTHAVLLILTALIAMIIHEMGDVSMAVLFGVILYLIPYGLAAHFPKPAPPPPPAKKPEMQDMRGNYY